MDESNEFAVYARARQSALLRTAFLLCGDRHLAEDLVQTTFYKLGRVWARARRFDALDAYTRQILTNAFLDVRRKPEPLLPGELPDRPGPTESPELRFVVLEALATLPPRARAVLVLRFWEDQSVEQTAAVLGITEGTVKSQTARSLARLREHLAMVDPVETPTVP